MRHGSGPSTTPTTTARSFVTPTATTSRRSATRQSLPEPPRARPGALGEFGAPGHHEVAQRRDGAPTDPGFPRAPGLTSRRLGRPGRTAAYVAGCNISGQRNFAELHPFAVAERLIGPGALKRKAVAEIWVALAAVL